MGDFDLAGEQHAYSLADRTAVSGPAGGLAAARPWTDLASNPPGSGVRGLADAEWATVARWSRPSRWFRSGAARDGRETVESLGLRLSSLERRGWRLLHAVPFGPVGQTVDHVAIGPGGVHLIGLLDERVAVPDPDAIRRGAERATRQLSAACGMVVDVTPVVVVTVDGVEGDGPLDDLAVVRPGEICRWLRRRTAVLNGAQVAHVYAFARRSTTWSPATPAGPAQAGPAPA